jgi:putative oxidoreductase
MNDLDAINLALVLLRGMVGVVMLAHGYNHIWGGGKIDGTAGWFSSMGMKPGKLHAWLASITELAAGTMLLAGLLTPVAAAGVVGVMLVALIINHLGNGFFIFRPGEGWEYVVTLTVVAIAIGALGAGEWSLDHLIDDTWPTKLAGVWGLLIAAFGGAVGAAMLLLVFWKPDPPKEPDE